jgi:hypothetical protein
LRVAAERVCHAMKTTKNASRTSKYDLVSRIKDNAQRQMDF